MIIGRSPLRISLASGGTDLPSYYSKFGCIFASAAINHYVYTCVNDTTNDNEMLIRYSQIERVKSISDIHHPIIREALKLVGITNINIEITSLADQNSGTGLGSSGSFTTALLKTLFKYKQQFICPKELAKLASHIEIDILGDHVGVQDQHIAAYGGLTKFEVKTDGEVIARPLEISKDNIDNLQGNLVMVPIGGQRSASEALKEQDVKSKNNDKDMINNLHHVQQLGFKSIEALESGNLTDFGIIMKDHWEWKKKRSSTMTNQKIEDAYELALKNGAISMKLIGGGNSAGFLLFYTEERQKLTQALNQVGLKETKFSFDYEGTKIL